MGVICIASPVGAPGVTTTAIVLAEHWPGHCLVLDTGHQLSIEAGLYGGQRKPTTNLLNIVEAARISPDIVTELLWERAQLLQIETHSAPTGLERRIMPGLPSGAAAPALNTVWPTLAAGLRDLDRSGVDVIVDLGRLRPEGIDDALVDASSRVLLMMDPTLSALVRSSGQARRLTEQLDGFGARKRGGVVTIRPPLTRQHGIPRNSDRQVAAALGFPVVGEIDYDPAAAAVYSDHAKPSARDARGPLARSAKRLAQVLQEAMHGRRPPDLATLA